MTEQEEKKPEPQAEVKKDPVTYSEEDLKKMEEDVKRATGEEQSKKVQEALEKAKAEMAKQREFEALKKQQEEMQKRLEEEKKLYAQSLENLKKEAEENTKKMIEALRDERQSTVNTQNPFKSGDSEDVKKKVRDPEYFKEVDKLSEEAFWKHYSR